ncbi:hypothetical protein Lal_00026849 [Lupinus albus]|nr:hypothetical protein Lal_00026849 [Lupinus albus]
MTHIISAILTTSNVDESNLVPLNVDVPPTQDEIHSSSPIDQTLLKTTKKDIELVLVGSYAYSQDATRWALAKMIIFHEYPMSMVDHILFKEFCGAFVKGDIVIKKRN